MACGSCTSGGCSTDSAGGCGKNGSCSTGGCNKLNTFDWLSNMEDDGYTNRFNVVEVRFKAGRKEFFRNINNLDITTGDAIIVEMQSGHHLGYVAMQGELVRLQMKRKSIADDGNIKQIYRVATPKDLEKYESARNKEMACLFRTRQIIHEQKLEMKLTDVEFQGDGTKATFYYSADERVDFRELIKVLAGEFKVRVEMKQISLRQEAGRLGGIGTCGRELCCSTWIADFKSVSTSAARYQNLSLNPAKLSGQCGRLKCCLNYELDTYMDALKGIPEVEEPLLTEKGKAVLQKTDIFRRVMWFGYTDETLWLPVSVERVNEILEMNKKGKKPASLETDEEESKEDVKKKEQNDLERFDDKFKKKKKKKKRNNNNRKPSHNRNDNPQS
ncbi:MAG: stage 0 sporulation family protein [Cytophagaceae bacterium]